MRIKRKIGLGYILSRLLVIMLLVLTFFPFVMLVNMSLKPSVMILNAFRPPKSTGRIFGVPLHS